MKFSPKIEEFNLPDSLQKDCAVVIPTVGATRWCNYGEHNYYFLNFKTLKGFKITLTHSEIIKPGFKKFTKSNYKNYKIFPKTRSLFQEYHYGFNFLEQIMLMTVPHTVTEICDGRFFINLWSYFGYIDIDCNTKEVFYRQLDDTHNDYVLGSQQVWDEENKSRYYMTYSLTDSMQKVKNVNNTVHCKVIKENSQHENNIIWEGEFTDYIHDMIIDKNNQYCIISELGMHKNSEGEMIPSEVLIIDMINQKEWKIGGFMVAAHAQFDPVETGIVYFSNHNFEFEHNNIFKALKNAMYKIHFKGAASVFKYRLTENGPQKVAEFTDPDFFRLTNFHVFNHRGQKILVAMGFPNYLYVADAETMEKIKRIEVNHPNSKISCSIGTFSPSPDGEKLFVHTNGAFLEVDIETAQIEVVMDHKKVHSCSNHMITSTDVTW